MKLISKFLSLYSRQIFLGCICVFVVLIKAPDLNLPHYWDEAFPYSYAIGHMVENGPSMLPDAAPTRYTTGHPLLYYLLQASWNWLVGDTLWIQRMLPLMFSILSIYFTFLIGRLFGGNIVGIGASFLLAVQSSFLAQASFQLPEMLLTMLVLSSIYFLLQKRRVLFVISASLMVFTKEPAVVILFAMFLVNFFIIDRNTIVSERLKSNLIFTVPIILNIGFYISQYAIHGWFFFPRHTGFMSHNLGFVWNQFTRYGSHLFIYSGRNAMFFSTIITGLIMLYRNQWKNIAIDQKKLFLLLTIVMLAHLTFSAFNFYSNRYILCCFPLFALLTSYIVFEFFTSKKVFAYFGVASLGVACLFLGLKTQNPNDHSLGYSNAVRTQMQAIDYCVSKNWQEKSIKTGFLMAKNLTSHYPRYVDKGDEFLNVNSGASPNLYVISSNEREEHSLRTDEAFKLVERFVHGEAWCEVYVRIGELSDYKNVN